MYLACRPYPLFSPITSGVRHRSINSCWCYLAMSENTSGLKAASLSDSDSDRYNSSSSACWILLLGQCEALLWFFFLDSLIVCFVYTRSPWPFFFLLQICWLLSMASPRLLSHSHPRDIEGVVWIGRKSSLFSWMDLMDSATESSALFLLCVLQSGKGLESNDITKIK